MGGLRGSHDGVSLIDALDNDLLAPFHYIGVTDYEKNGQTITDTTDLKYLVSDERVAHLIKKTRYYGPNQNKLHGLIFVSRIEEGQELARKLNQKGYRSIYRPANNLGSAVSLSWCK